MEPLDLEDELILGPHPMHDIAEHETFMEHVARGDHALLYLDTLLHEMVLA